MKTVFTLILIVLVASTVVLTAGRVYQVDFVAVAATKVYEFGSMFFDTKTLVSTLIKSNSKASVSGSGSQNQGLWRFDEGSGTGVGDSTSNSNDGTLVGTVVWQNDSPWSGGSSLEFGPLESYLSIPDSNSLDMPSSFTVTMWIKPESYVNQAQLVFAKGVLGIDRNYSLGINYFNNPAGVWAEIKNCNFSNGIALSQAIPLNTWSHIALRYDHPTKTREILLNGVVVHSQVATVCDPLVNDEALLIGGAPSVPWPGFTNFQGNLDDFRTYTRPLTDIEILDLVGDIDAPWRYGGSPSGLQPEDTAFVNIVFYTDESATCKIGKVENVLYDNIVTTADITGGTSHSHTVATENGRIYRYYTRCMDAFGNKNVEDYTISFSIDGVPDQNLNIYSQVETIEETEVRITAGEDGEILPLPPPIGERGVILDGPIFSDGDWWWKVDFKTSTDGWVPEQKLDYYTRPRFFIRYI